MLEVKDLVRVYKPKKGEPVRALDGVSLKFPDKGMVFILGKSGSGKSTLLNVMGGLDKYDEGEIIIKGKSSKDFSQDDFDSYRNTYLGFIFQEYNILDEFTVGVNIGLALQLQGKKATEEDINRILAEVDMVGYADRKPNELSGGQKQRVAIARALVKNPQIIMADEPTGALDSATGLQVFDTLKKLSKDKLVLVVTHDREFAEMYGDRVIELKDGKVISDISKHISEQAQGEGLSITNNSVIQIKKGYRLTPGDLEIINKYVAERDAIITLDDKLNDTVRKAARLNEAGKQEYFTDTDNSKIVSTDPEPFKLIKSRLPYKHSLKIGASSLKHKRFRLAVTIFLSFVAFAMFGLADTISAYDKASVLAKSIADTGINYLSYNASKAYYDDRYERYVSFGVQMKAEDVEDLKKATGLAFRPVYYNTMKSFYLNINMLSPALLPSYLQYNAMVTGFCEFTEAEARAAGFAITGRLPEEFDEIAITDHIYSMFKAGGYQNHIDYSRYTGEQISTKEAFLEIEPVVYLNGTDYKITGIVDTGFNKERYAALDDNTLTDLERYALTGEYEALKKYGYHGLAFVKEGFLEQLIAAAEEEYEISLDDVNGYCMLFTGTHENPKFYSYFNRVINAEGLSKKASIFYLDENDTTLDSGSVLLPLSYDVINFLDRYEDNIGSRLQQALAHKDFELVKEVIKENKDTIKPLFESLTINYSIAYNYYEKSPQIKGFFADTSLNDEVYTPGELLCLSDDLYEPYGDFRGRIFSHAITPMPESMEGIRKAATFNYSQPKEGILFTMQNEITSVLYVVNSGLETFARVFLYVGLGLAFFAAVLLTNYISTSISYKKREIGILRAVGARSSDVFGIFFNESLIIALINFILASVATGVTVFILNTVFRRDYNLLITFLLFGIRQVGLILGSSLLVAFIASFIPVMRIARKKPIDAINNR